MPRGGISPGPSSGLALGGGLCFPDDAVHPAVRSPFSPAAGLLGACLCPPLPERPAIGWHV